MKPLRTSIGAGAIFLWVLAFVSLSAGANAAELRSAHVTQIINDVKLLPGQAAARAAVVNDSVGAGTAVRTGVDSRTELTFSDLTITRLGANTVFSFNGGARQIDLGSGAVLVQVPRNGAEAKISTAAATAAISGGTGLLECNKGFPTKHLMLEGIGRFYPNGHPEEAVIVHGGEMVMMTVDGQITRPTKFNAALVYKTSKLITSFPPLPNADLILAVIELQQAELADQITITSGPPKDSTGLDTVSLAVAASTTSPGPSGTPSKFGPPSTITSPDPYLITSGTTIQTDPSITTSGMTDFGKIYRGPALDGSEFDYLFGSTSAFDMTIGEFFNTNGNGVPVAVFKFSHLELTGNPTITIPSGATTFLGLVSVGDVTSGAPGGTLTFAGLDRLFIATVDGSITLGSEISFSGIGHVTFYARGSGSNLTLGSAISGGSVVHLFAEGTVQVNGDITAGTDFKSFSGGDFLAGSGIITATNIDIESLSNINIDGSRFPNPPDNSGSVVLNAANTLNIAIIGGGQPFGWDSLNAAATTINLTSSTPTTFDFSNSSSVTFTAGTGGINAPNIAFFGSNLTLQSGGDINIGSFESPPNDQGGNIAGGTINAAGAVNATGNITNTTDLTAGTSVSVGGDLGTNTLTAGTTIDVGGDLFADTVTAGGNITANGVGVITINAPMSVLTAGSDGIFAEVTQNGAAQQNAFNISSIVSPNGIDFSGNQFNGIGGLSSGGRLTINANTLTFDSATGIAFANFNGADAGAFGGGSPSEGGDGGVFVVNTTGNITANQGADITATTGSNTAAGVYSGAGGSVTLLSSAGTVTVNDTIQVSSNDSRTPRQSATGGTILLQSDLTSGTGITVGANGQLLSLLNANAPGPGGSITLSTMGANIVVNGTIEADRGTITMDQNDPVGPGTPTITIDGAFLASDTLTINGIGDVLVGQNNSVSVFTNSISVSAQNNLSWQSNSLSLDGPAAFDVNVASGTTVATSANLTLNTTGDFSNSSKGDLSTFHLTNQGTINQNGNISLGVHSNLNCANGVLIAVDNELDSGISATHGGAIGGASSISVGANTLSTGGFLVNLLNENDQGGAGTAGGHIGGNASIGINVNGALTADAKNPNAGIEPGIFELFIENYGFGDGSPGGFIGSNASVSITAASISSAGDFAVGIDNSGGGMIGGAARMNVTAGSMSVDEFFAAIYNLNFTGGAGSVGGQLVGAASITFNITGALTVAGGTDNDMDEPSTMSFVIDNSGFGDGSPAGSIGSDASINVTAGSISDNGRSLLFLISNGGGGMIGGNASITVTTSSISATGPGPTGLGENLNLFIDNSSGGSISQDATAKIQTANIFAAHNFVTQIDNFNGTIGGKAALTLNATGDVNTGGLVFFGLFNNPGAIESDASVDVSAASLTAGSTFEAFIENIGGTVGGNATVQVGTTGNLNADHLFVVIDSSSGGSVGGNETINMNVSGTATVNNEATVQILGPDPTGSAAINFNDGTYEIGGTFFNTIDGNGTITFTNTDIHANVVQAGVFGPNGSLIIGGSGSNTISADTLLKLYAPGSNGLLKFVASVTLSSGTEMDLAANSITINSGVTVTIAGTGGAANVYTNHANYTGFGGNGSTTGTFAGNVANPPQALPSAPPFNDPPSSSSSSRPTSVSNQIYSSRDVASSTKTVTTPGGANLPQPLPSAPPFPPSSPSSSRPTRVSNQTSPSGNVASSTKTVSGTINVSDSAQLLSLLSATAPGADGSVTIPASNSASSLHTPERVHSGDGFQSNGGTLNAQKSVLRPATGAPGTELPKTQ